MPESGKNYEFENVIRNKVLASEFQSLIGKLNGMTFLLQIVHNLGVPGNVHALMASYLTHWKQVVNVNSENSNLQLVERGVPQRSILGPLLFLLYKNDIGSNANIIGKLFSYADDTVFIGKSLSETGDLKYLQTWLALNKIDLNYTKSKFVTFEKRAKFNGNIELDE